MSRSTQKPIRPNRFLGGSTDKRPGLGKLPTRWARLAVLTAGFLASSSTPRQLVLAESDVPTSEYDVKAAFLYNFAKFVEWPPEALPKEGDSFCIGVVGDDPFRAGLDQLLAGKTVQGHPVAVRHFDQLPELARCQILFFGPEEASKRSGALASVARAPVLTVGDSPTFPARGGILGFQVIRHRVRFNVNLKAAEAAQLVLSSELLKVANKVMGAPEEPVR